MTVPRWTAPYLYLVKSELTDRALETDWNDWYTRVHVPGMLSVPGISSVRRYAEVDAPGSYLAVYEIESPTVFDETRYHEVRGWGPWTDHVASWSRAVARIEDADRLVNGT